MLNFITERERERCIHYLSNGICMAKVNHIKTVKKNNRGLQNIVKQNISLLKKNLPVNFLPAVICRVTHNHVHV